MSKEKKITQPVEPVEETQPPVVEEIAETAPAEGSSMEGDIESLKQQLETALSQSAEYKDGWQRALADFTNYKRRMEAERVQTYQMAVGDILKDYLPVVDDLERALRDKPSGSWADGIELIYRKLRNILEAKGLTRMDAEGQMFDPNFHEAISQEPSDNHESGQIIEVVAQGYMLGERVIRPAMVRVAA
jgi:molecular chaperone GrpE